MVLPLRVWDPDRGGLGDGRVKGSLIKGKGSGERKARRLLFAQAPPPVFRSMPQPRASILIAGEGPQSPIGTGQSARGGLPGVACSDRRTWHPGPVAALLAGPLS